MLEGLTFLFPWMLGALAALPALWWLLRVMPPRPRIVKFPAFFLLKDIAAGLKTAAHTPWWLLFLRSLAVILFILAMAEPVLHPAGSLPGDPKGPVLIVFDNGWASASGWQARLERLREYLHQARRGNRPVIVLPTAASAEDGQMRAYGPMEAFQAEEWSARLQPQPWPAAHQKAAELAQKALSENKATHAVFFSDGLGESPEGSAALLKQVKELVTDDDVNNPHILRAEGEKGYSLERLHPAPRDKAVDLLAWAEDGTVTDKLQVTFPAGQTVLAFSWDMLPEVRNKTMRLALHDPAMASGSFLAGARWRQHPVGIVADAAQKESRDFLNEVYYLRRALEANSQITIDQPETLLKSSFSVLVLPDGTVLAAAEKAELLDWVRQGGFLIRFGGPHLAANPEDALLPVPIRSGQRAMEGAMTWETPAHLGAISEQSPLYGLTAQQDVTVARQVLADPSPEVFEKTWLQLEDGTPLITGGREGKGTVVLIHTSAGPDWSDFCYSGLFVESLQRMVALSNGMSDYKPQTTLPPLLLLDGFGNLHVPDGKAVASAVAPDAAFDPSPQTPPGLYGNRQEFTAFNLGDHLPKMRTLKDVPAGVTVSSYQKAGEVDLKPPLVKWAVLLLLMDTLATLWLRGILARAAVFAMALSLCSTPAAAVETKDLVSGLYLGYIETGDADIDRVSHNGLTGLGEVIGARTTAKIAGVAGLDPERDPLVYYPVIYWPMSDRQRGLSVTAVQNIQNYLSRGGMILFDTRDRQFGGAEEGGVALGALKLRELTQNLQIPELTEIPKDHILSRSFYLLDEFPGRYAGGKLWVEKEPSPRHDAVTSVAIGANDWAAAWSKDAGDQARFMVEPGGERQREMAYRFGVNLVMVALTGNYKADQVHVSHILERLGK